jgi:lactoylglutathione lyase
MSEQFAADIDHANLHVCLRVRDLDRSLAFYRDLIGLPVLRWTGEKDNPIFVWLPGLQLGRREAEPGDNPYAIFDHVGLSLKNLEAVHGRLQAAGHTPERPLNKTHFPSVDREVQTVFYRDPDGNLVELLQWQ